MAPFLFRGVKGVSISCTSPASAATCTSYGGREFDRRRRARNWAAAEKQKSCPQKTRKSSEITGNLISPASSSRYLLDEEDDGPFFDPDEDPVPALTRIKSARFQIVTGEDSAVLKPSRFSASYSADSSRVQGLLRPSSASLSSSSRPSLPSTRLEITSGDDSPVPSLRSHTAQGDDRAVIKQSPLGGSHARAFFRSSSSLSEMRFPSPVGKESDILSSSARTPDQVYILMFGFNPDHSKKRSP